MYFPRLTHLARNL
ncbi:hypothetical protein VCHFU02_1598, partial [Vibrio cholerae HFU-02]